MPLRIRTATGLRSLASTSQPKRRPSRGMAPPPAKGSSSLGGLPSLSSRMRRPGALQQLRAGDAAAAVGLGTDDSLRVSDGVPTGQVGHLLKQLLTFGVSVRIVHQ